ncbi:MAG TPA: hypothetical protein VEC19_03525 [Usitatibacter sp.]|nr:hypothetical protein [Usitatibacter sp.]
MSKRKDAQPDIDEGKSASKQRPERDDNEPDTLEGPGGRHEAKGEEDARNKTTRRGER